MKLIIEVGGVDGVFSLHVSASRVRSGASTHYVTAKQLGGTMTVFPPICHLFDTTLDITVVA